METIGLSKEELEDLKNEESHWRDMESLELPNERHIITPTGSRIVYLTDSEVEALLIKNPWMTII